jgi:hypothetical protein
MADAMSRPHPDVVWRRVGAEVIVVNLKTGCMYSLNYTGARLWELISAGHDRAAVETALIEEFDVEEGELRRQVAAGLEQLAKAGLVVEG